MTVPQFTGALIIQQWGRFWILKDEIGFVYLPWLQVTIPAEFFTDLGSVPRLLWWWVAPTDPYCSKPFLLHDYLYERQRVARSDADFLLWLTLRHNGTRRTKAWLIWAAVRVGGRRAYRTAPARQDKRRRQWAEACMVVAEAGK